LILPKISKPAGPFQTYSDDAYRVAIAALNSGAHYVDLSDDGSFTKGITSVDHLAKQAERFVLSGASSTPAISGAAVSAVKTEFKSILKIESTILPGGRAPKGYSVMWAILNQVGNPVEFWREGSWVKQAGWSQAVTKCIGQHISRQANLIQTADVVLFPEHFKAETVLFRAGLAQSFMHRSLHWLGYLRARGWLPVLTRFIKPFTWLANRLSFIGSDHGGMLVEVIGVATDGGNRPDVNEQPNNKLLHSKWALLAEPKEGPFIPAIAVRTLLRNTRSIEPGARPCIDELPLSEFVAAMGDIGVSTESCLDDFNYLFESVLQTQWHSLPTAQRLTHSVVDTKTLQGSAKITRGSSFICNVIAGVFRFPKAVDNTPVVVTKSRLGDKEVWLRKFGDQLFKSTLNAVKQSNGGVKPHAVVEQFGLLTFELSLPVKDGVMHMNVERGSCLGIPIPKLLLPVSNTFGLPTLSKSMNADSGSILGPICLSHS